MTKKVVMTLLVMLEIINLFLMYKSLSNKPTKLDEVKLFNDLSNKGGFAFMIENDDGEYVLSDSDTWPDKMNFNEELSGCMDSYGKKVEGALSYNASEKKAYLSTNQRLSCYLYFDKPKPSVTLTVSTDGVNKTLPVYNHYKTTLTCNNATASFSTKYQRLEISEMSNSYTNCNLNYTKDSTSYTLLSNEVKEKTSDLGTLQVTRDNSTYTPTATLDSSSYNITNMETTSDSNDAFVYDETTKKWTSQNHTDSTTSNGGVGMSFTLPDGYYQLCYTMGSEKGSDYGIVTIDGTEKFNTKGKDTSEYCEFLGNITSSNVIRVSYRKDGGGSTSPDNIIFYIQSGTYNEDITTEEIGIGYRYTGKQPDNFVWYNNELWRIIGLIPTCTNAGCTTKENLVKIIRNEVLGGYAYHSSSSNTLWGSGNTLYTLLNEKYYGKLDATGSSPCLGYSSDGYALCNYTNKGIASDSNDYYGRMIKSVYMNGGTVSSTSTSIDNTYKLETATQTVLSKIGLMNVSDYGYATSGITYSSVNIGDLDSYEQNNWMYGQNYEWTMTPYGSSMVLNIYCPTGGSISPNAGGSVNGNYAYCGFVVRPALYLEASVYVISGDGTEANPYILGM